MDIEKIKENIEEVQKTAYKWTCPRDEKVVEGPTKKKVISDAKQHIALKHKD